MKWQLMLVFLTGTALSVGAGVVGCHYYRDWLSESWHGPLFISILVLLPLSIGYVAAQRLQSQLDKLHLAMLQASKGNISSRITCSGSESLLPLYQVFNEMSASMENRLKLLQQLGEENVMLQSESEETAVLEERKRLARDLHDTVSQQLFALHMSASSLPKVLERRPEVAGDVIEQLIQMSYHAQKQMRGLIAQLRPLELEDRSLTEALEKWFPDYCRHNQLQGNMTVELNGRLSEAKEHQLFLIIQEAMANIVKHASARHVTLSLRDLTHSVALQIEDDGAGFDRSKVSAGSYGLSTMRERAQKLGGDAEIITLQGSGTQVKVTIPRFQT